MYLKVVELITNTLIVTTECWIDNTSLHRTAANAPSQKLQTVFLDLSYEYEEKQLQNAFNQNMNRLKAFQFLYSTKVASIKNM